jgi:predicted HTH transcriptional regulator
MLTKRLADIDLTDIEALKDNGVAESHFLDFKATGVGASYDEHREFLADVSAFANASGGDIIYGVTENAGVANGVPGFDLSDPDKEELRLTNLLRDGTEPRLSNVGIRWLTVSGTRRVLVVRIPRVLDCAKYGANESSFVISK